MSLKIVKMPKIQNKETNVAEVLASVKDHQSMIVISISTEEDGTRLSHSSCTNDLTPEEINWLLDLTKIDLLNGYL